GTASSTLSGGDILGASGVSNLVTGLLLNAAPNAPPRANPKVAAYKMSSASLVFIPAYINDSAIPAVPAVTKPVFTADVNRAPLSAHPYNAPNGTMFSGENIPVSN